MPNQQNVCCGGNADMSSCCQSKVDAPGTFQELVQNIREIFSEPEINVEKTKQLMASYNSKPEEWEKYAMFDKNIPYSRNLVDEGNGKYNLLALCWNQGQGSSIHSHSNSHCFLKVLQGSVKEEMYDWPSDPKLKTEMVPRKVTIFEKNQCEYINDDIGLHRVQNPSLAEGMVTLHLYTPPFPTCKVFNPDTSEESVGKMVIHSRFGEKVTN